MFGTEQYVGHDEPSLLFYSNVPGSGNRMRYTMTLPKEPPPNPVPGRSYSFMLNAAIWFGLAMCDTQSYPEVRRDCTPNSDTNITSLDKHPGMAYEELQFYPPGYVKQFTGFSCAPTQWCAALNIFSLSLNPLTGQALNASCQRKVGVEYGNFAYLTHDGIPQGPPNPLDFKVGESGTPNPQKVLFMNGGDTVEVTLHDTPSGLQTVVRDLTTGQSGSMTASAANGFGQIKFAPEGDTCKVIPYNFHPMYSTTTPATRVTWAAHTYNVAFSGEIGHFDWCSKVEVASLNCVGQEGPPGIDQEAADTDDRTPLTSGCFPDVAAMLYRIAGCLGTNAPGFDGASYQNDWPDGNTNLHPSPTLLSSPRTGADYTTPYSTAAFEIDTPRIEGDDLGGACNRLTGVGCTLVPPTDDGHPATFYPFYTANSVGTGSCQWALGNDVPGLTINDFGKLNQYGTLTPRLYLKNGGHGAVQQRFNVFYHALGTNPCP